MCPAAGGAWRAATAAAGQAEGAALSRPQRPPGPSAWGSESPRLASAGQSEQRCLAATWAGGRELQFTRLFLPFSLAPGL